MYSTEGEIRLQIPKVLEGQTTAWVNVKISEAAAVIDSKLREEYTVPFSPVPPMIKVISDLLVKAWCLRDIYQDYTDEKEVGWYAMEKRALGWLEDLKAERIRLDTVPVEADETLASVGLGVDNIPIYHRDETETDREARSQFYLPAHEEPI